MSDYIEFVKRMGSFDMELSLDDIGPNKDEELKHYGILGMKWGVRRFQNKDGTLTPAGKIRYQKNKDGTLTPAGKNHSFHDRYGQKSVEEMSDAELRRAINRLHMERQYSQLRPSTINKGKEYAQKVFKAGTSVAAITTATITIYNNIGKIKAILEKKR